MVKIDPYNHEETYCKWKNKIKERGFIPDISQENSSLILKYLDDMEKGLNISLTSKKGSRSFIHLNKIRGRLIFLSKMFSDILKVDNIAELTEEQLCGFFADIRNGIIKKQNGDKYLTVRDFVKNFKAFWHWYQKVARKAGKTVEDITLYLDASSEKPKWVYLDEEQVRKFSENCLPKYKTLIMFLYDSGIRAPTELLNVKVSDLSQDCKELTIREETSKTFGRRIKLMLCSELIKRHIQEDQLTEEDYLFKFNHTAANRYLQARAKKLFGEGKSLAGEKYSKITMYDFRHCSCCYWLPRYKSESALKFRFGWKKSDKIHYYSELLGMRDTISEEDLLIDVTKTELEQKLKKLEQKSRILEDNNKAKERQIIEIQKYLKLIFEKLGIDLENIQEENLIKLYPLMVGEKGRQQV